jgi:hypothetical protein
MLLARGRAPHGLIINHYCPGDEFLIPANRCITKALG